jgi:hypothetical protein
MIGVGSERRKKVFVCVLLSFVKLSKAVLVFLKALEYTRKNMSDKNGKIEKLKKKEYLISK